MVFKASPLPYRQTNAFTRIALDYIDQAEELRDFFKHPPSLKGIQEAILQRRQFPTNREILVEVLKEQYKNTGTSEKVLANIDSLLSPQTFTVTTAHQNNLFTGPLYFIYKIVHTIRIADELNKTLTDSHFVPVFYIGSEDADLEELNHIWLGGEKRVWNTAQKGAVGRMMIDQPLLDLIDGMEGQLVVLPHGSEIIALLRKNYILGRTVQEATFDFVNALFSEYGLLVLLPDNRQLKSLMYEIFKDDLLHQTASAIVEQTAAKLESRGYKVQANPRQVNLFYLEDGSRERIEKRGDDYIILGSFKKLPQEELFKQLREHPDKFSPNVILRGIYQEIILPDIAFIGGAGETAYWLQLKELFDHYHVPFPVLILRNSFLLIEKKWKERINKLGFQTEDIFLPEQELLNRLVRKETSHELGLNGSIESVNELYSVLREKSTAIDPGLGRHVEALKTDVIHKLQELEKKMLRAEKRKFSEQQRQLHALKAQLFPGNGLQERRENLIYRYAKWGPSFLKELYNASLSLEQEFMILEETD